MRSELLFQDTGVLGVKIWSLISFNWFRPLDAQLCTCLGINPYKHLWVPSF